MRSILNTMPIELPFDFQRAGHHKILVAPLANRGKLLPFILPQSEARAVDSEWLVMVDSDGKEIKRIASDGFLEISGSVIWNNQVNDIYQLLGDEMPCGYYYYLASAGGKQFKTDIFFIDNTVDKLGSPGAPGQPQLPVVPKLLGDYNSDYGDDYFNKTQ
jgi:hypothetical protein